MIANYGYKDGSGEYYISIDTDKCDGCNLCVPKCPAGVFEVGDDPFDPFRELPVAKVTDEHRNKLKYSCASCKPDHNRPQLPCMEICPPDALSHSW